MSDEAEEMRPRVRQGAGVSEWLDRLRGLLVEGSPNDTWTQQEVYDLFKPFLTVAEAAARLEDLDGVSFVTRGPGGEPSVSEALAELGCHRERVSS